MENKNPEYLLDHQDWKQVIINTHNKSKHNNNSNKTNVKKLDSNTQKLMKIEKKADKDELKHEKISNKLRTQIIQTRNSKNLTQKQLANFTNMPLQKINEIESGKAIYNAKDINKIKRYLKISNTE
jgi:ribosome-binding protein aMBF1 (putative translation factor)